MLFRTLTTGYIAVNWTWNVNGSIYTFIPRFIAIDWSTEEHIYSFRELRVYIYFSKWRFPKAMRFQMLLDHLLRMDLLDLRLKITMWRKYVVNHDQNTKYYSYITKEYGMMCNSQTNTDQINMPKQSPL